MKIVYTSRTGNVQSMIERLGIADAIKIGEGVDKVAEEYILFSNDGSVCDGSVKVARTDEYGYVTYGFTDYLVDDYTVISWDQRGCGRTYIHNRNVDVNNDTASFEQALVDLDQLVQHRLYPWKKPICIVTGMHIRFKSQIIKPNFQTMIEDMEIKQKMVGIDMIQGLEYRFIVNWAKLKDIIFLEQEC